MSVLYDSTRLPARVTTQAASTTRSSRGSKPVVSTSTNANVVSEKRAARVAMDEV